MRIEPCSGSSANVPSLSSASTTIQRPPVHRAPEPTWWTSPPTMKLGASPADASIMASIDVVVVLPCVPATASVSARAQIDASMPARRSTGMPRRAASASSTLSDGTAVDAVTASTPRTSAGSCPTWTSTPTPRRRSRTALSRVSLPDTRWPMPASTSAMGFMPGPPTPTTW